MSAPVAVVTGASSGIGRALAQQLDAAHYALTLCDVNEPGLRETQALLQRPAHGVTLDVSKRHDVEAMAAQVLERHGRVDLVINNAGVTVDAKIAEITYDDFAWLFDINFWGVVHGTKAFLPAMLGQRSGTIVNISSIFGIVSHPGQGAYNAAKFAVRGFTEALWRELADTGVHAVSVHPGGVKTNIARSARVKVAKETLVADFDRLARTTPERAAAVILRSVAKRQRRVLIGADAIALQLLQRVLPAAHSTVLGALQKWAR